MSSEEELDRAYQVGVSTGLEEAASVLMAEAILEFRDRIHGEDIGPYLRFLALKIKALGESRHPNAGSGRQE